MFLPIIPFHSVLHTLTSFAFIAAAVKARLVSADLIPPLPSLAPSRLSGSSIEAAPQLPHGAFASDDNFFLTISELTANAGVFALALSSDPGYQFCMNISSQPIFLITDGGHLRKRGALLGAVRAALEGANGRIGHVLLREQHPEAARLAGTSPANDRTVLEIASELLPLCRSNSAKLIINRNLSLAEKAECDGVHLGKEGPTISEARAALGPDASIGFSAHTAEEVSALPEDELTYCLLSPIYNPLSKRSVNPPLGLPALQKAAQSTALPVFALGGITRENARGCIEAGASGVAMISSVLLATDPGAQARAIAEICATAAGGEQLRQFA